MAGFGQSMFGIGDLGPNPVERFLLIDANVEQQGRFRHFIRNPLHLRTDLLALVATRYKVLSGADS